MYMELKKGYFIDLSRVVRVLQKDGNILRVKLKGHREVEANFYTAEKCKKKYNQIVDYLQLGKVTI